MTETKHPDQGEGKTNSENMDNDQGTDLDYDELTSQQSQDDSGTDMDNTLEHEGDNTETPNIAHLTTTQTKWRQKRSTWTRNKTKQDAAREDTTHQTTVY